MKNTGMVHIFSGKVFCLECEHYLRKKNSARHEYLVCSNNRDGYNDCINKSAMRYDTLEDIVLNAINDKIKKYYDEELLKKEESKKNISRFADRIKALEIEKKEIEQKILKNKDYLKSLYKDKVNGIITINQFEDLLTDFNKDEDKCNKRILEINNEMNEYSLKQETSLNNKKIFSKYKTLKKLNRVIVDEFIDKIYIGKINKETNTRNIQIKWNFE